MTCVPAALAPIITCARPSCKRANGPLIEGGDEPGVFEQLAMKAG
jgi:hypothetical protein